MAGIRWLDLNPRLLKSAESELTEAEFHGMGLIQRREYEEAKTRLELRSQAVAHG